MVLAARSLHRIGLRRRSRLLLVALAFISGAGMAEHAAAHALVLDSTPGVDSVLTGPDLWIELRFNSRIDSKRSKLSLLEADGRGRELALLDGGAEGTLSARVTGLAAGAYRLRWQVLAVDGHITRGDIPFRVQVP